MNTKEIHRGFAALFLVFSLAIALGLFGYQKFFRESKIKANAVYSDVVIKQDNISTAFNNPTTTVTSATKTFPVQFLSEAEKQQDKLLAALRKAPYFDEKVTYPTSSDSCAQGDLSQEVGTSSVKNLTLAPGIFISTQTIVFSDSAPNDYDVSELHIYDEKGNHTGPVSRISGGGIPYEERVKNVGVKNYPGIGRILHIRENFDGNIKLVGKNNSGVDFEIRGNGNSCTIARVFIPTTKHSVATIPMTADGNIGPISYDIDGDEKEDLVMSLIHPLLLSKQLELSAVMNAMQ